MFVSPSQSEPPTDHETYIHRSGRTGRAGKSGTSITLYAPKHLFYLQQIERKARVEFLIKGCPQPSDLMVSYAREIETVSPEHVDMMRAAARKLLETKSAEDALSAALFVASGMKPGTKLHRSMLTGEENQVTIDVMLDRPVRSLTYIWNVLRGVFDPSVCDQVRSMRLRADSMGAVCDIPASALEMIEGLPEDSCVSLAKELPEILEKSVAPAQPRGRYSGRNSGGGRGFGGGRGGRGGYSSRRGGFGGNRRY